MSVTLLAIGIVGLIGSIVLLFCILVKHRIVNVQKVWDLAVAGDRLARIYMVAICASFVCSAASVVLMHLGM